MEMARARRQLARHDAGLAKAPQPIARPVAGKIAQEDAKQLDDARPHEGRGDPAQHPRPVVMQILRQVVQGRGDLLVHHMPRAIGRMTQRPDRERQAEPLQA